MCFAQHGLDEFVGVARVDNILYDQNTLIFNIFSKTDKILHLFGTFGSGVGTHLDAAESALEIELFQQVGTKDYGAVKDEKDNRDVVFVFFVIKA